MSDLEAAKLQVGLFDRRNAERMHDGEPPYGEPSHITFARALIAVTAERGRLLAVANRVLQWFGANDPEDAAILDELTAVVQHIEQPQPQPEN